MTPISEALVLALRRHRTPDGRPMSQATLGEALGLSQAVISKWARGVSEPSLDDIARIETILGLRRGQLLIEAGYVDSDLTSVEAAIDLTDELDVRDKETLKLMYRSFAGR